MSIIKKAWSWFKRNKVFDAIVIVGLMFSICFLVYTCRTEKKTERGITEIEFIDSIKTYHKMYYEGKIHDLKEENSELYDSIKAFKDQIDYLVQFTYTKSYHTGKVKTEKAKIREKKELSDIDGKDSTTVYTYGGSKKDTLQYRLRLASEKEPEWYSLDIKVSDKFTIINKEYSGGLNETTIQADGHGQITEPIVIKPQRRKFWDRFRQGPSATIGYDVINNNIGFTVGWGVSIDL